MDWPVHCAVLIPCFNEAASIQSVVTGALAQFPTVIVVDDASTDNTAERAANSGAFVTRVDRNSGKGAAIRQGCELARSMGFSWVLMMDGDGQHAAEDIPRFLQMAETSGAQLIVGNRMGEPRKMPPLRRWVNRWMSRRLSRLTGTSLPDSQCGFRLAHLETWSRLSIAADRFVIESEMLVAFLAAGCGVEFVPVQVIYHHQGSKIRPLSDGWRWLRWWGAQCGARSIAPREIGLRWLRSWFAH